MKAVAPLIVITLIRLGDCVVKRQCSCFNARQFAATACQGITDFENLFEVSGSTRTIAPFGSVLGTIAGRSDSRTVIDEICASQSCFSRLDTLYSCCTVCIKSSPARLESRVVRPLSSFILLLSLLSSQLCWCAQDLHNHINYTITKMIVYKCWNNNSMHALC